MKREGGGRRERKRHTWLLLKRPRDSRLIVGEWEWEGGGREGLEAADNSMEIWMGGKTKKKWTTEDAIFFCLVGGGEGGKRRGRREHDALYH